MRKIMRILKSNDMGDMGIGAMIVFIAMVLVAGIAASVLVQTANKLEIQAMSTGQQTTAEVSTGLAVIDIEGKTNAAHTKVMNITVSVKSRSGSRDIDLSQTIIEVTDGTKKVVLNFNSTCVDTHNFNSTVDADGQIFGTSAWNTSSEFFGIIVLQDSDGSVISTAPVINRGDLVMLTISCNSCFSGLDPRDDISGTVIPEEGAPGIFAFTVPASLSDTVYDLY